MFMLSLFETGNMLARRKTFAYILLGALGIYYFLRKKKGRLRGEWRRSGVVAITGCDSGLGFSLASHFLSLGLRVAAGCLGPAEEVRAELERAAAGADSSSSPGSALRVTTLDLRDPASIEDFARGVEGFCRDSKSRLLGLVNNAGVMVFGEFEWMTSRIVESQLGVNLVGTMALTKAFIPILRRHASAPDAPDAAPDHPREKGTDTRLINVLSHCSTEGLPGLSVYCASKAALDRWTDALRVELSKFNVKVIKIIPGGFVTSSRILAGQREAAEEMRLALGPEAAAAYSGYFEAYMGYLLSIPVPQGPVLVPDPGLYADAEDALLAPGPRTEYKRSPLRYRFYYTLFKILPVRARDWAAVKFMSMPDYEVTKKSHDEKEVRTPRSSDS